MAVLNRTSCLLIALAVGLASTLSVRAQAEDVLSDLTELSLEALMDLNVVTAARHRQKSGDAPASVTVITARDIDAFGYRTLAEALRSVTGFYITNDRNYTTLGVRGFAIPGDYSNRVLLLIDGARVNDPAYHQPMIDQTFPVPIEAVKQIEIVRGPGSVLYGGNALLAVINVITKDGADIEGNGRGGGALKGEGGAHNAARTVLAYGNRFQGQADLIASGLFYRTDGDAAVTSPGLAAIHGADKEQASLGFAKLRYKDLTLSMTGSSRLKDIPTASFNTLEGPGSKTTDGYLFSQLRYDYAMDATKRLSVKTAYNAYNYTGQYLIVNTAPSSVTDNRDLLRSSWSRTELQFQWDVTTWNKVTVGGAYERALDVTQRTFNLGARDTLKINRPTWSWGTFLQDELALGPHVDLVLGAGFDEYRDSDQTLNHRAAAVYRPTQDTTMKLLYGTASRAPTLYELFYTDGLTLLANPHLKIERIETYEAVIMHRLSGGIEGSLSAFQYRFKDLLSAVDTGGGRFQFQNVGRSTAHGLELSLNKRWESGAVVRLGGVVQQAKDFNGVRRTNSPRVIGNAGVVLPLLSPKTILGFDTQYLGERRTIRGRDTGDSFVTTAHLRIRDLFGLAGWDGTATVTNLFNERAFVPGGNEHRQDVIPSPGRAFLLGAQYTF